MRAAFLLVIAALVQTAPPPPQVPGPPDGPVFTARERRQLARLSPLPPPPPDPTNRVADDPRAARLGQWLFFDPRLSGAGEVSCATCHDPAHSFSDGRPVAETLGKGTRKTPSLVNAAHLRWLFWDGRADSLWAQALEPIENPIEMGGDRRALVRLVATDPQLAAAYSAIFGALPGVDGLDPQAIDRVYSDLGKAIAAYERRLVRVDAPFDRFVAALLAGDREGQAALGVEAQRGLKLFLGRGRCSLCHNGPNLTDSEFHNTSAPAGPHGDPDDPGRYGGAALVKRNPFNAAGPYSDDPRGLRAERVRRLRTGSETFGEFKTPSLRNLAGRAPYMHAGQFADLDAVLGFYSRREGTSGRSHHQEQVLAPLDLTPAEIRQLRAFLESLEGRPLETSLLEAPPTPSLR